MTAPTTSPDSALVLGQVNPYGSGQISVWAGPGFRTVRTTKLGETEIVGARRVDHEDAVDYGFGALGIQYFLTDPDGLLIQDVAGLLPVSVLDNDTAGGLAADDRINGSTLAVTSAATHGLGISYQAQIWYAPHSDYVGADSFSYTITNDGAETSTATAVTIDVQGISGQHLEPLALSIQRDSFITIDASQAFETDEPLTIQTVEVAAPPAHGMAEVLGTAVTYSPVTGFTGADSFSWRMLINGTWTLSAPVALTVSQPSITPAYNVPGTQIIHPAEGVTHAPLPVVYATPDAANTPYGTPVTLALLENDLPLGGVTLQAFTQPAHGTVVANGDGTVTYTPQPGYSGPDSFDYTMTDGIAARSAPVTLMVLSPLLVATQNFAATVGVEPVAINVLSNDIGTGLSVTLVSNPTHGTALILSGGGSVQYQADLGFVGDEVFFYTTTDTAGHTANGMLTVTVLAPTLQLDDDFSTVTPTGTPVVLPVLDHAIGTGMVVTAAGAPASGLASTSVNGTTVTYVPQPTFAGQDSFTVTVTDAYGQTATATASVFVQAAPIVIKGDAAVTSGGTAVLIQPLTNDVGDGLTVTAVTTPAHGTAVVTDSATVTYTPTAGYLGADSFTYTAIDAVGQSGTATVVVDVRQPQITIVGNPASTVTTTPVPISVLANDTGVGLEVTSVTTPGHGTATFTATTVTYTAAAGYTGPDSFNYTATDDYGQSGFAPVSVEVLAAPATVKAVHDNAAATSGVIKIIPVLTNDTGTGLTISAIGARSAGGDAIAITDDTEIQYTSLVTFTGVETFDYTISDGTNSSTATVTVTVSAQPVIAIDDQVHVDFDTSKTLSVLANDVNPATLTIAAIGPTDHGGSAVPTADNKQIVYTPAPGFAAVETFTYTATDGFTSDTATVTVEIGLAPIAANPSFYQATAGVLRTLTPLDNATGTGLRIVAVSGSSATITIVDGPLGPGTQLNYTADASFSGLDEFDYTIEDATT